MLPSQLSLWPSSQTSQRHELIRLRDTPMTFWHMTNQRLQTPTENISVRIDCSTLHSHSLTYVLTLAHQALWCHVDLSLGHSLDHFWITHLRFNFFKLWCVNRPSSKQVAWPAPQGQQHHLLISGDEPSHVGTRWWWLCINDDEDLAVLWGSVQWLLFTAGLKLWLGHWTSWFSWVWLSSHTATFTDSTPHITV